MAPLRSRCWQALSARASALRERHGRAFWIGHSLWALAQGVAVGLLAEARPDFGSWVLGLLALVWVSTLFFSRSGLVSGRPGSLRVGAASYATRVLYQQTLFFLLPFYVRSTTPASPNLAFTCALGGLAALACLDLSFDRWLRRSPAFAATFFFAVAYAALQLLLPLSLRVPFALVQPLALGLAFVAAAGSVGIARGPTGVRRVLGALPAGGLALALMFAPRLVPPAPLRIATFALARDDELLRATVRVAAPIPVPVEVTIRWRGGGALLRSSRSVAITAHDGGFRVWDELARARLRGSEPATVELLTSSGQLIGSRRLSSVRSAQR